MSTGDRIRQARKAAGLTQVELGKMIGKGKSLIWNYETGYRMPDRQTLQEIADALGVTVQSLEDRHLDSVQDVLEVFFQMEEAGFGIEPVRIGSTVTIAVNPDAPHAPKLEMALEKWAEQKDALKDGRVSECEYAIWRGSFGADGEE
ncbi:helix-turn-helix domain-containing protein [Adlercreutzia sp. ZJ138]|uniref:helix-turn-helix domain-containing protein n=1 Tax=Adlercreutzia sp. ZJ138 TaxID=2709405 RepID=UPI0013ED9852|nr:helix-turn-helix transcriptional regulator [Adlercreutzia sp. ZJ138]